MAYNASRKEVPSGLLFVLPPPPPPPPRRRGAALASSAFPALKSFSGIHRRGVVSGDGSEANGGDGDVDSDPLVTELRPIWVLLCVLGCAPLDWSCGDGPRFRWASWRVAYAALLWALLDAAGVWVAGGSLLAAVGRPFDDQVFAAVFFVSSLPHFVAAPAHLFCAAQLAAFLRDWGALKRAVGQWRGAPLRFGLKRWAWAVALGVPVTTGLLFQVEACLVPGLTDVHVALYYTYVLTLVHLHAALWWLVCCAMAKTANAIADHRAEEVRAGRGAEAEASHRVLWLRLNAAARALGSALGVPMLLLCVIWGTLVVVVAYGCLAGAVEGAKWRQVVGTGAYAFLCLGFLLVVCDAAHRLSSEVGEASARALLRVAAAAEAGAVAGAGPGAEHLSAEAGALLRHAALQPPSVSLAGFVTLDRGFLSGYLSSVVTYLIVLVQFRMGQH